MAFVQGGAFTLGEKRPSAGTVVAVTGFCLDLTEVTVGAYRECVASGACQTGGLICAATSSSWKWGGERTALNCIDYVDSAAYCAFAKKRLPAEDEWEWAARGGFS